MNVIRHHDEGMEQIVPEDIGIVVNASMIMSAITGWRR